MRGAQNAEKSQADLDGRSRRDSKTERYRSVGVKHPRRVSCTVGARNPRRRLDSVVDVQRSTHKRKTFLSAGLQPDFNRLRKIQKGQVFRSALEPLADLRQFLPEL